jgi:hypothetical protein
MQSSKGVTLCKDAPENGRTPSEYGRSCHRTEEPSSRMEELPYGMGDYALEYGLGIGIDYEILYRSFLPCLLFFLCTFLAPETLSLSSTRRKLSSEQVQ